MLFFFLWVSTPEPPPSIKNIHRNTKVFLCFPGLPLFHHRLHRKLPLHEVPTCLWVSKKSFQSSSLKQIQGLTWAGQNVQKDIKSLLPWEGKLAMNPQRSRQWNTDTSLACTVSFKSTGYRFWLNHTKNIAQIRFAVMAIPPSSVEGPVGGRSTWIQR